MNRAVGVKGPSILFSLQGDDVGAAVFADDSQNLLPLFHAAEDCLITSVKIATSTTNLGADATSVIMMLKLASTFKQGDDSTDSAGFSDINGDNDVAIGVGTGCDIVLNTDSDTGMDTLDTFVELLGKTATGGADCAAANLFNGVGGTDHANTAAVSSSSSVAMNAGDSLMMLLHNSAGGAMTVQAVVTYRPVKDQLNLSPSFTQKTFSSKAR